MTDTRYSRRVFLALGVAGVMATSACVGRQWKTDYTPVGDAARNWRLSSVNVVVPRELRVSETNSVYVPDADIVWQEEALGDRYAQVGAIVKEGVQAGARGLSGATPVRFNVVVRKFHALNRKSLYAAPQGTGVENVDFEIQVVNARTGAVILPYQMITAELPGLTGVEYEAARARGETQRMRIAAHIGATVSGWLGTGPDNRFSFYRAGG